MNHPALTTDEAVSELGHVAVNKPSNSDVYTVPMARFVETFARVLGDPALPHLFFIDGGALAVENALKIAFDWKSRWNEAHGIDPALGTKVLHLEKAFHGRTGYTMSLTNTDPNKVARFPKFDWPRIASPSINGTADVEAAERAALAAARTAFEDNPHDIACFIIEPIQGEGGDNHFRPEFFKELRRLADQNDAMLVFDEVQAGFGLTGKFWSFEHYGVTPDMVGFGKKSQICGFVSTKRIDEVQDNVFHVSSRINSTWGGTLVDMVRSQRYLEIMAEEKLLENATARGAELLAGLEGLVKEFPEHVMNARGKGMMCAFDLRDGALRDQVISNAYAEGVVVLGCGPTSIRFRPPLVISKDEIAQGLEKFRTSIKKAIGR
jgi:L-lysine 6-transaminase